MPGRHSRHSRTPLVCRQLVEMVSDYLDGGLDPIDRRRIEDHLEGCDGCTAYVEQVRALLLLTSAVDRTDQLPVATMDRLRSRFADRHPGRH